MMTTNLFVIANVIQLRTDGSCGMLLLSEQLGMLASLIRQFLTFSYSG